MIYDEPLALAVNHHWRGKPSKAEHARWDTSWERAILTPRQVLTLLTEDGGAITCSLKRPGARNSGTFDALNLVGLDFDQTGIDDVLAHPLAQYASFAYESSSSTPDAPRCRLIFALTDALDFDAALKAIAALQHAFASLRPDPAAKDPTRCWYGSVGKRSQWIGGLLDGDVITGLIEALPESLTPELAVTPVNLNYTVSTEPPDLNLFGLSEKEIDYIHHPLKGDGNNRHGEELKIVNSLVSGHATDEDIYNIWKHYPIGSEGRYSEQGQGDRYLALTVAKARGNAPHRSNQAAIDWREAKCAAEGGPSPVTPEFAEWSGDPNQALRGDAEPLADPTQGHTAGGGTPAGRLHGFVYANGNGYRRMTFENFLKRLQNRAKAEYDADKVFECAMNGQRGAAVLLTQCAGDLVCYFQPDQRWLWFDGVTWCEVADNTIIHMASELVQPLYAQRASALYGEMVKATQAGDEATAKRLKDQADAVLRNAGSMKGSPAVRKVLDFAKSDLLMGRNDKAVKWDSNVDLLGVNNGVVSLVTGKMVEPEPLQMIRTCAPVDFDPNAKATLFEQSVLEVLNDCEDLTGYVQRLIGYATSGTAEEAIFPVFYGEHGRNGKEFLMERIRNVLGDRLAGTAEPELLLASRHARAANSSTEAVMTLRGRRIAWVSETNEGRSLDLAKMKDLSGGHILTGRHNHGSQQEWRRTHTPFMLTNHKPHVQSQGLAEWSRIRLIEFKRSFVAEPDETKPHQRKVKPTLGAEIDRNEASGVLNWIIDGCMKWRKGGLQEPQSVKDATKDYQTAEDTLGLFLQECCAVEEGEYCSKKLLYIAYTEWMYSNGKPLGRNKFYEKIAARGIEDFQPNIGERKYRGLKITVVTNFEKQAAKKAAESAVEDAEECIAEAGI